MPPTEVLLGPWRTMLALFFALGRFLGTLGPLLRVSWLLVGFLGWFCRVQGRSGLDFGGFGTLLQLGVFFEPPTLIFSVFGALACLLFAQAPDMQKPRKNLGLFDVLRT